MGVGFYQASNTYLQAIIFTSSTYFLIISLLLPGSTFFNNIMLVVFWLCGCVWVSLLDFVCVCFGACLGVCVCVCVHMSVGGKHLEDDKHYRSAKHYSAGLGVGI